MMTYYHPSPEMLTNFILEHGFPTMGKLYELERYSRVQCPLNERNDARTLVCSSYEAAVEYSRAYWGEQRETVIIAIEGEYENFPIHGTMVPEGTTILLQPIPASCVSLAEPTPAAEVATPRPSI